MAVQPPPKRFVNVFVAQLPTQKMRMEQQFLLLGIGFGLQRPPPSLERRAIRSYNPSTSGHYARAVVGEQVLKGDKLGPLPSGPGEERGAGIGPAIGPPIVVKRNRTKRRKFWGLYT